MGNYVPKRAFTFVEAKPGEKIYELCITLRNIRGAVAKTAQLLSEANVNILSSMLFDAVERGDVGYWTSFVDLSKALKDGEQIEDALRKLDVVQDVKVVRPEPLAFDTIHFPLMHGSSVAVTLSVELMGSLFGEIERILTPSGFAAVFYNAGKKSGAFMSEFYEKRYGFKGGTLMSALIQSAKATGWGEIVEFKLDQKKCVGKVRVRASFEARLKGERSEKVCHWTRGFVAGAASKVIGRPVEAVESKCAGDGDEICEFEIKPEI